MASKGWNYKRAGVDIKAQDTFIEGIKKGVATTHSEHVLEGLGGFGGLYQLEGYQEPVLVASTDGVGTKLLIAQQLKQHDTIGQDLVAMCVNDILVQGATPLFFLDYLATGSLDPEEAQEVLTGIISGCQQAGCALLGGETAEMPDFYPPSRYDLAGFALGVVERGALITGEAISPGDLFFGLPSSGLHSNGYSLVRRLLLQGEGLSLQDQIEGLSCSLGEELLRPTRIYASSLVPLFKTGIIKGMAHITGGGILDNVKRILPDHCQAQIYAHNWPHPPIFQILEKRGNITAKEMFSTFNMGIGFVLIVAPEDQETLFGYFASQEETIFPLGEVALGKKEVLML